MHGASPRRQGVFRPASPHAVELLGTPRARVCPKQPRASSLLRSLRRLVSMCARDMSPGPHQCSWPVNQGRKGAAAASHPAGRRTDATFNHARGPWQIRPAAGLGRTALVSVYGPLPAAPGNSPTDDASDGPSRKLVILETLPGPIPGVRGAAVGTRSDGRAVGRLDCDPQDVPSAPPGAICHVAVPLWPLGRRFMALILACFLPS